MYEKYISYIVEAENHDETRKNIYLVRATENGLDQKIIPVILPKMVRLSLLRSL